ncbi:type II toxin-antitoxin system RelE/ParE family toxin [Rhodoplanes sp. SY1]|uniref:type II toxin-antitoxin system RelE/ParE family toxin n=1 Tax=Rhodoplanes sp. SY1 TaxID=3166646 RepID=UPI0038B607D6
MKRHVVVRPQARLELAAASDWYDEHAPGIGDELLRAFETTVAALAQNPFRFQVIHRNLRRVGMGKFPYGLFYTVSDTDIIIVACIHGSRDPKFWKNRV